VHREALAIQTRAYGEEHLALVDTLIQLSGVTTSRRDYEQSKSLYLRAAAILSKHFPSDDPAHASVQYSLARLLWSSRQYPAAEQAYRDLLVRYPDGAASNPPVSGQELWSGLASSLWVMDKFPQAEAAYRRAIELQRQKHAVNPEALSRLALVLFEQDKFNESADQLAEAISINRQMVARDPANSRFLGALGEALNLSGACAYYQGRFSEADRDVGAHFPAGLSARAPWS
jgi:tetratricopeptide (TPR) repeat protein